MKEFDIRKRCKDCGREYWEDGRVNRHNCNYLPEDKVDKLVEVKAICPCFIRFSCENKCFPVNRDRCNKGIIAIKIDPAQLKELGYYKIDKDVFRQRLKTFLKQDYRVGEIVDILLNQSKEESEGNIRQKDVTICKHCFFREEDCSNRGCNNSSAWKPKRERRRYETCIK